MRLLVIEPETVFRREITRQLSSFFLLDTLPTLDSLAPSANFSPYDAILVGTARTCHLLRQKRVHQPILLLCRYMTPSQVIEAYQQGIDGYLTRPIAWDVLRVRLFASVSHALDPSLSREKLQYRSLFLDRQSHQVWHKREPLFLRPKEFRLLECFLLQPYRTVSREYLLQRTWQEWWKVAPNSLESQIKNLRKKLFQRDSPRIRTVYGAGYRLE